MNWQQVESLFLQPVTDCIGGITRLSLNWRTWTQKNGQSGTKTCDVWYVSREASIRAKKAGRERICVEVQIKEEMDWKWTNVKTQQQKLFFFTCKFFTQQKRFQRERERRKSTERDRGDTANKDKTKQRRKREDSQKGVERRGRQKMFSSLFRAMKEPRCDLKKNKNKKYPC